MSKPAKTRDYLFDNYKAMLIILVIIGHFIQPCYENNALLYTIKYFIYAFHMPAFILISGYFSKKDAPWQKAFQKVLVPYLAFEGIYYLYYNYVLGLNASFDLEKPKFSLWYLLALFVWKVVTPYVKKIPHYFSLSIVMGLLIGLLPSGGTLFSISRIFVFYPYFLAGTLFDRTKLTEMRTRPYRIASFAGIAFFALFLATLAEPLGLKLKYFYGKTGYAQMGQGMVDGILVRLLCYGIGFFLTYAFAILMTEKQTTFSKLGGATMAVYLFHGLFFKFLEHRTDALELINTIPETLFLLAFCVGLAFAFSCKPFCTFVNSFANLSLTKIGEYAERASYQYNNKFMLSPLEA